jgi:hypothetical protein
LSPSSAASSASDVSGMSQNLKSAASELKQRTQTIGRISSEFLPRELRRDGSEKLMKKIEIKKVAWLIITVKTLLK